MNHCYVEFKITSTEQFSRLQQIVEALRKAKEEDQFPDDEQWKQFFSDEEISTFWWPTEKEREDWSKRWYSKPFEERISDPTLRTPWDFGSMLDAIREGEYSIVGLVSDSFGRGRLEFVPQAYPFGGTGAFRALILAYGHGLIGYDDGTGYTSTSEA